MDVGTQVRELSHPGESFTVLKVNERMRAVQLRSADGREFWVSRVMVQALD